MYVDNTTDIFVLVTSVGMFNIDWKLQCRVLTSWLKSDQLSLKEFLYPIKSSGAGVLHFTLEIVTLKVNQ